ncbi:MAG: PspC domain-containing protein [Janthinobacterium lividum]
MEKKLYRDESRKVIAGVCAGLSDYFGIDVMLVRLVFVLTLIYHGGGTLAYIVLWIVMPKRIGILNDPTADYTVHNENRPFQNFNRNLRGNNKNVAQIGGAVLIVLGVFFLLDQLDLIPYWFDFETFWPVILVIIGLGLIFRSKTKTVEPEKSQPKEDWSGINPNDHPKDI